MKTVISLVLLLIGALGIARTQPTVVSAVKRVKQREDVTLVPPPQQTRVLSLHYYAMTADLLWTKLLLEYGAHWSERRVFNDAPRYIDAILALEPTFRDVYRYVDSILCFRSGVTAGLEEAKLSRAYFERGTRELPNDHDIWLRYGQFLAFFGPTYVQDEKELEEWRVTGARAIIRAVELGADADAALSATSILSQAGERDAAIQHLTRAYALADDRTREDIAARLARLKHDADIDQMRRAYTAFNELGRERYPYLAMTMLQLLGPLRDPAKCAGLPAARGSDCYGDWSRLMADRRRR